MAKEPRNIPATKGKATATLTKSQVDAWKADGWTVGKAPKVKDDGTEQTAKA